MLKYKEITDRLSVKQKIALITDVNCLSDPAFEQCGIPHTATCRLGAMMEEIGEGLSPISLARAWNPDLIRGLTGELAACAKERRVRLLFAPTPKMKFDPFDRGATEDPYLSTTLTKAYLEAIRSTRLVGGVDGFRMESGDMAQLDAESCRRVIREYFVRPFQQILAEEGCGAVLGTVSGPKGASDGLNRGLLAQGKATFFRDRAVLCEEDTPEATVSAIREGYILMKGVARAIEDAYEEYLRIQALIEAGHASVMELEEACAAGSAISPSMLDAAVDRVIDLAFTCQNEGGEEPAELTESGESCLSNDALPTLTDALRQSIVLLKNEKNILPLQSHDRIAILGDLALRGQEDSFGQKLSAALGNSCIGMARGYGDELVPAEELLAEAEALARNADRVLIFVGEGHADRSVRVKQLSLPAQQLALLDRLKEYREKIVAVLVDERSVDMRFDRFVSGLVLSPMGGTLCAKALGEVLSGAFSPCGRLGESYYDDPEGMLAQRLRYKRAKQSKIGPFLGYRYYDSEKQTVRYPFGFGLSYTTFAYSDLRVSGNEVFVTVENTGDVRGSEVVQVYVGRPDSKLLRPDKELKGFCRVELGPHEKKEIVIRDLDWRVFDENCDRMIVEHGDYLVSVGSSVQDIRKQIGCTVEGEVPMESGERRADYLQSISNIVADEYTLEAENTKMKKYWGWSLLSGLFVALAVIMDLFAILLEIDFDLLLIVGNAVLFVLAVLFFIIGRSLTKKQRIRLSAEQKEQAKERFETAEEREVDQITDLFVSEFDLTEVEADEGEEELIDADELLRHMNRDLTLSVLVDNFIRFAEERGVSIGKPEATSVFASFLSSRLLFINSLHGEELRRLAALLCDFLGSPQYGETIGNGHLEGGQLLFVKGEDGSHSTTQVMQMISHASEHPNQIHMAVLYGVRGEMMSDLLLPYIRYFNNPQRENTVSAKGISGSYQLSENLWFILELAEGESLENLPSHFSEIGSLIPIRYTVCDEAEEKKEYYVPGYGELTYLGDQSKNYMEIPEDLWKKLDGLEAYVDGHSSFQIGNKLSLQMEKYLCVYCACGQELPEAWDRAVAANLLPMMMAVLKDKVSRDERTLLETVEQLFGEDNVEVCRRILRNIGA